MIIVITQLKNIPTDCPYRHKRRWFKNHRIGAIPCDINGNYGLINVVDIEKHDAETFVGIDGEVIDISLGRDIFTVHAKSSKPKSRTV